MPLSDLFAAFRWWAALLIVGAAATPLCLVVLRRLPDRGYAFVKMLGVLLVSLVVWLFSSLGYLANDAGSILFGILLVVAASYWAYRRTGDDVLAWLRQNSRHVLITELLFAFIFFFWAWVRAQNPAITGTEKPMEFAFLNAVGRSAQMPPLDPWLSGYAISYYYFGYVMTSVIARLAVVAEPVAFNLGIAWLVAGTAVGAFGLVFNVVAAMRTTKARRGALALALVAALAIPLAGNMQILLELLHANGVGSPQFWSWLDVRDIDGPPTNVGFDSDGPRFWWWWRSSRVIHEYHLSGVPEEGLEPIAEFPGFSFVLGDMHPHVLALPFAFLSLALALAWWLRPAIGALMENNRDNGGIARRAGLLLGRIGLPLYATTVVVLGGLSFLNTWDVLIHLFVFVATFLIGRWRDAGSWRREFLGEAVLVAALLAIPAILLYLPFYLGFRSQAGPPFLLPMLMRPTRLAHFLIIFGMPLWAIIIFLGALAVRRRRLPWHSGVLAAAGLLLGLTVLMILLGVFIAVTGEGSARIATLAADLGVGLPPLQAPSILGRVTWALSAVFTLAGPILLARLETPWMVAFLAVLIAIVVTLTVAILSNRATPQKDLPVPDGEMPVSSVSPDTSSPGSTVPFILLLVLTAALLTLGPEFLYIRDNFGQRLNTVFKFYYQAWILFGISALFALDYLWQRARAAAVLATVGYGAMLIVALWFPYYGITSRAQEYTLSPTLDGVAHYASTQPDELAALSWLRQNVEGAPVIVEAVGGQYSPQGHGRVSAVTGLPTLVGWAGHEYQWRGATPVPAEREEAVRAIYTNDDWQETAALLNQHDVSLIYVGPLEISTYGPDAWDKFAGRLEVAYANDNVIIYRWLPT